MGSRTAISGASSWKLRAELQVKERERVMMIMVAHVVEEMVFPLPLLFLAGWIDPERSDVDSM